MNLRIKNKKPITPSVNKRGYPSCITEKTNPKIVRPLTGRNQKKLNIAEAYEF